MRGSLEPRIPEEVDHVYLTEVFDYDAAKRHLLCFPSSTKPQLYDFYMQDEILRSNPSPSTQQAEGKLH